MHADWYSRWYPLKEILLNPLNDFIALPPLRFDMFNSFARVRYARVFVRAHEGVGILVLVQITKRVVDLSMLRLVCSDIEEKVFHSPLSLGYAPVVCCEIRDHELRVCPLWEFPGVDILNSERVREHGLFLEVADEAVAGARRDEV